MSRLAIDVIASGIDNSKEPKFTEAMSNRVYYGPVYFRRDSEPYMTLALAGTRRNTGVAIAEVNLKFIWDVISKIRIGKNGYAYVVGKQGRLIAHPDISLVLRKTDVSSLTQVRQAMLQPAGIDTFTLTEANDLKGKQVISAFHKVDRLDWYVFVELPRSEAYSALYDSIIRSLVYLTITLSGTILAGSWLISRIIRPIEAIRAGAAQVGSGNFSNRISVKTGDELETLAKQFNDMAGKLEQSYAQLEDTVELRTRQLTQSVKELEALGKTAQVVNENLKIGTVLVRIVEQTARLSRSLASYIFLVEPSTGELELRSQWESLTNEWKSTDSYPRDIVLAVAKLAITKNDLVHEMLPATTIKKIILTQFPFPVWQRHCVAATTYLGA